MTFLAGVKLLQKLVKSVPAQSGGEVRGGCASDHLCVYVACVVRVCGARVRIRRYRVGRTVICSSLRGSHEARGVPDLVTGMTGLGHCVFAIEFIMALTTIAHSVLYAGYNP